MVDTINRLNLVGYRRRGIRMHHNIFQPVVVTVDRRVATKQLSLHIIPMGKRLFFRFSLRSDSPCVICYCRSFDDVLRAEDDDDDDGCA